MTRSARRYKFSNVHRDGVCGTGTAGERTWSDCRWLMRRRWGVDLDEAKTMFPSKGHRPLRSGASTTLGGW